MNFRVVLLSMIAIGFSFVASASEYVKLSETQNLVTWKDKEWGGVYSYIKVLGSGLFAVAKEVKAEEPTWAEEIIEKIESEHDIHENASYWGERYDGQCDEELGLEDEDEIYEIENYPGYEYAQIVDKNSGEVLMYMVYVINTLQGPNGSCNLTDYEFVVDLMDPNSKGPVFKGQREYSIPEFN
jgi:hypothetical protein